jgi:energy-converting hydrogenase Eha subunit E
VNIKNLNMRWATRSVRPAAVAGLVLATLGAAACGSSTAREGQSSSYPIISLLEGASGAGGTSLIFVTNSIHSDVITFVKSTNTFTTFNDVGRVTMRAAMRDVTNPNSPTSNNAITFNRYHIVYKRSDGRDRPGVDVPYAFDGAVTFTVAPGDEAVVPFELVRVQAKYEAPLAQLTTGGSPAVAISTLAEVTFYGHDQAGRETAVTGTIGVDFANWGDPEL